MLCVPLKAYEAWRGAKGAAGRGGPGRERQEGGRDARQSEAREVLKGFLSSVTSPETYCGISFIPPVSICFIGIFYAYKNVFLYKYDEHPENKYI